MEAVNRHAYPEYPGSQAELRGDITKILTPPCLDDYNLVIGQEVKFVPATGKNSKPGRVTGINSDGSILIADDGRAYSRSIVADNVFVKLIGPRGGTSWVPLRGEK